MFKSKNYLVFSFITLLLISTMSLQVQSIKEVNININQTQIKFQNELILANGSKITSDDFTTSSNHHPFGNDTTKILGDTELLFSYWQEDLVNQYQGSLDHEILGSQSFNDLGFSWFDDQYNFTHQIGSALSGDIINASAPRIYSGDFNGDFRNDYLVSYTYPNLDGTTSLIFEFQETLEYGISVPMGSNIESGFILNQTYVDPMYQAIPSVYVGDLDGDYMSEIAFVAKDTTGSHKIWILDDLRKSILPSEVNFGDFHSFRTMGNPTEYLSSELGSLNPVDYDLDTQNQFWEFQFIDPRNLTNDAPVNIGSEVSIRDATGKYWSVDATGIFSLITTTQIGPNEIFTITDTEFSEKNDMVLTDASTITLRTHLGTHLQFTEEMLSFLFDENDDPLNIIPFYFKVADPAAFPASYTNGLMTTADIDFPNLEFPMYPNNDAFNYDTSEIIQIADLDNDKLNEIIIVGFDLDIIPNIWVLDDIETGYNLIASQTYFGYSGYDITVNLATGNVDADENDEIVISLTGSGTGEIKIVDLVGTSLIEKGISITNNALSSDTPSLAIDDITRDGLNEIIFLTQSAEVYVYRDESSNFNLFQTLNPFLGIVGAYNYSYPTMAVGDINSDGFNEILISSAFDANITSVILGFESQLIPKKYHNLSFSSITLPRILIADLTGDYTVIEYSGGSISKTTAKQVFMVSAGVPYHSGTSQATSSNTIGFGINIPGSPSEGNMIGISYNSYTAFDQLSHIGKTKLFSEFNEALLSSSLITSTPISTEVTSVDYNWDGNDNYVIFSTAQFTEFNYVLTHVPDPREVGSTIFVNIPKSAQMDIETVSSFLSNLDPSAIDISSVFGNIIGDVSSYPNRDQISSNDPVSISDEVQIGSGTGISRVSLDATVFDNEDLFTSFNVTSRLGSSFEFQGWIDNVVNSGVYSHYMGRNTTFQSEIGNLQEVDEFEQFQYSFGMGLYPYSIVSNNEVSSVFVLEFWTNSSDGVTSNEEPRAAGAINDLAEKLPGFELFFLIFILPIFVIVRRKRYG